MPSLEVSRRSHIVTKDAFHEHLRRASASAFECARRIVRNALPDSFRYTVRLNASYDGNPLEPGEQAFPDDLSRYGSAVGPLPDHEAVELLWREGLIPERIDISVEHADSEHTHFELLCCGRFAAAPEHLSYSQTDCSPFGPKSPVLPPRWEEEHGPFDLHWRINRNT